MAREEKTVVSGQVFPQIMCFIVSVYVPLRIGLLVVILKVTLDLGSSPSSTSDLVSAKVQTPFGGSGGLVVGHVGNLD